MMELDRIELVEVDSDSAASENMQLDREMNIENTIMNRINEDIPENMSKKKLQNFDRLEMMQKNSARSIERSARHDYMASKLIEIMKTSN